ncbi:P-loop containing nucleoside triphosphate hydrolase protein [Entophlyctis helioformis]|nr:P-loop containing nucleoside triphosphate hydrolase protein [Entophlyctis helioformis]
MPADADADAGTSTSTERPADVDAFVVQQLALIEQERQSEMAQVAAMQQAFTPVDLQRRGVVLLALRVTGIRSGLGGRTLVDLEAGAGGSQPLPPHKFRMGDIVSVDEHAAGSGSGRGASAKGRAKDKGDAVGAAAADLSTAKAPTGGGGVNAGVVYRVTDTVVTVAFREDLPDPLPDRCKLSKLANNITYERMSDAVKGLSAAIQHGPAQTPPIVFPLFGLQQPVYNDAAVPIDSIGWFDTDLNPSQREAVRFALAAQHLALIHGPPGTGKTYTCVELVRQLVKRGDRVLVCGPSNVSVDNLVERLARCKLDIVRVGHPARVLDQVLQHTLDVRVRSSDEGRIVNDVRRDVDKTLAAVSKTRNKGERRQLYQDVKHLRRELKTRERTVVDTIMRNAQVVLSTLNGAASRMLENETFDTVLIDEATQALEAECWIAILKGKRLVLAGDHLQLPPTVKSVNTKDRERDEGKGRGKTAGKQTAKQDKSAKAKSGKQAKRVQAAESEVAAAAAADGTQDAEAAGDDLGLREPQESSIAQLVHGASLETTLFDRMLALYGDTVKRLLNVQYRMNEHIMAFSSRELYDNKLIAHESVKHRLLTDRSTVLSTDDTTIPLLFIDTSALDLEESVSSTTTSAAASAAFDTPDTSKLNQGEAVLVRNHVDALVAAGVLASDIAVITPYNAQVALLRAMLRDTYPDLEIGSVDGFQGREKDAVVISLVRSNPDGDVGFLADRRRLNVAITRPRRHLCIVGNAECVRKGSAFLARLCDYLEDAGEVRFPDS